MTLNDLLKQKKHKEIWQKYCGFVDLSLQDYMRIQSRLMLEQIELMSACELGQRLMHNRKPATIEEYRRLVPLTTYSDYADILLKKQTSALPAEPVVWIETTWEGGKDPVKLAPYSEGMLKAHRAAVIAIMLFATSKRKGSFSLRRFDRLMYGMAPMPYLTGLIPYVLDGEVDVEFLPDQGMMGPMSLSHRNSLGMNQAMRRGIDLFFGVGTLLMKISEQFITAPARLPFRSMFHNSVLMNYNLTKAWLRKRIFKKTVFPKDIWDLKGLVYAGTDAFFLKDKLENYWGVEPLEVFGGAELSCIAAEAWSKNGLVMFPDVCFYEFIPESELAECESSPLYVPKTSLMNELQSGVAYELVFSSFKGGAFLRYRAGYMFLCVSTENEKDGIRLPQFRYLNRLSSVIDIAGYVRITEKTIEQVIELSKLPLTNWFAVKEYNVENRPYLHLYVELGEEAFMQDINGSVVQEQLILYFNYLDLNEWDLESLFGINPLVTTVLPEGIIKGYEQEKGQKFQKINPPAAAVAEILRKASSL
ncbi:MAG: GH3 auxin-responsive promoter family protein [Gracilibacteraceae bacterium]|jgi:hypothetical protein|nr:GH3 auxin-responsive promoter family protein [Gracilibacteraceae bacterium]